MRGADLRLADGGDEDHVEEELEPRDPPFGIGAKGSELKGYDEACHVFNASAVLVAASIAGRHTAAAPQIMRDVGRRRPSGEPRSTTSRLSTGGTTGPAV